MSNVNREIDADGLCWLRFDRPGAPGNLLDRATLDELDQHLDALPRVATRIRGLVLLSAKETSFLSGPDLHALREASPGEAAELIEFGQAVFGKVAALTVPSVAALHGATIGGGCELSLACDWRIASPGAETRIGLPATTLGLIPAWGGSTRLPRLLGVPAALDLILEGRIVRAAEALDLKLIDEIVARESLPQAARTLIRRGKQHTKLSHSAPINAVVEAVVAPQFRHRVEARAHGHYPALQKAMAVVMEGAAAWNEAASLRREREAFSELLATESTRQLLALHFTQENARRRSLPGLPEERRAAIIGGGTTGAGLTQWLSARGMRVILQTPDPARVAAALAQVDALYAAAVKARTLTEQESRAGRNRVSPTAIEVPLRQVDVIIETGPALLALKQETLRRLEELARPEALLATEPAGFPLAELGARMQRPERLVGLHFPSLARIDLVEVVAGAETEPTFLQRALSFIQRIGKLPVLAQDRPGLIVHRILLPYLGEAARLFEQGGTVEEIDAAMIEFGMATGPLQVIDELGADRVADGLSALRMAYPEQIQPPDLLTRLRLLGWLGRKSGRGFYLHGKERVTKPANSGEAGPRPAAEAIPGARSRAVAPVPNPEAATLQPKGSARTLDREKAAHRLVLLMINEAAHCLGEGVAGSAGDLDLAMVKAAGFPPFRGGPLRYADQLGAPRLVEDLARLVETAGERFQPAPLLAAQARSGQRFHVD